MTFQLESNTMDSNFQYDKCRYDEHISPSEHRYITLRDSNYYTQKMKLTNSDRCDKNNSCKLICLRKNNILVQIKQFQDEGKITKGDDCVIIPVDNIHVRIDTESRIGEAEDYKCWPPPWFVVAISAAQLVLFLHYTLIESHYSHKELLKTIFLWKPAATLHVWRYVVYSLYHIGWVHLCFNLAVQLCIGVPLEMIHGASRVAVIYMAGVVLGSVSTVFADDEIILVGSSSGVYALLAAHVADVILNYEHMELGCLKLFAVIVIALLDVALAWMDQTSSIRTADGTCTVSSIAHVTGAVIGLLMGIAILKTFSNSTLNSTFQRICRLLLVVILIFTIYLLLFNSDKIKI